MEKRPRPPAVMLAASTAYLALLGWLMISSRIAPTPDFLVVLVSPLLLLAGRFRAWLHDWLPFVVVLLLWDGARSLAYANALSGVHSGGLQPDLALGGGRLPTAILQEAAAAAHLQGALDVVATAIDLSHFPSLFLLALLVWFVERSAFGLYVKAVFATAFIALAVFVIAPTSPPWYASDHGQVAPLRHVMATVVPVRWMGWYDQLDPNPVAALPSLHAALPLVSVLALRRLRTWLAWPVLAWTLLMWASLVYLGEHYVTDVAAGALLATCAWTALQLAGRERAAPSPRTTTVVSPS